MAARFTLIAIGLVSLLRGWAYVGPSPLETPGGLALVDEFVPLHVYGGAWCLFGAVAIAAAAWPTLKPYAIGANLAVNGLWFASLMWGWIVDGIPRAWVSALAYGLVAWLIFREGTRRDPVHVHVIGGVT